MLKQVIDEVEPAIAWNRTGDCDCACASVCSAQNVAFVPAVFENEQDVIPESVSVLFQDPTDII